MASDFPDVELVYYADEGDFRAQLSVVMEDVWSDNSATGEVHGIPVHYSNDGQFGIGNSVNVNSLANDGLEVLCGCTSGDDLGDELSRRWERGNYLFLAAMNSNWALIWRDRDAGDY